MKRLALLLLASALLFAACGDDDDEPSGDSGTKRQTPAEASDSDVVFVIERLHWDAEDPGHAQYPDDATQEIAVVSADGKVRELTSTPEVSESNPRWSADRSKIYYTAEGRVWSIEPDGSNAEPLTEKGVGGDFDVSPDGKRVVFVINSGEQFKTLDEDLYLVDVAGGEPKRLTRDRVWVDDPVFSPDGSQVAYTGIVDTSSKVGDDLPSKRFEVFVVGVDGGKPEQVTDNVPDEPDEAHPGGSGYPDWSPDGTQLAHWRADAGESFDALFVMNSDGTGARAVNDVVGTVAPAWSPDGGRLAFAYYDPDSRTQIFTIKADGSGEEQLTRFGPDDQPGRNVLIVSEPDW